MKILIAAIKANKPLPHPEFEQIGSILYKHIQQSENQRQKIRAKVWGY